MNEVLTRIREVFNENIKNGLTQTDIADIIDKTPQYVWKLLNNDESHPSKAVIKDICKGFGINEEWIKYGDGERNKKKDKDFSQLISDLEDSDDDFIKSLIRVYMGLDDDSKKALRKIAEGMAEKYRKQD